MNKMEILQRVNRIFKDVFDDDTLVITYATTADDIEDWDSLIHITLVVSIEKEFNIKFTVDEAMGFKDVGEMIDVIAEKTRGKV